MSRIFISHSSANNDWAIKIRDWLVQEGWGSQDDIFLDLDPVRGIKAGERWKAALQREAQRCELVLALVSKNWLDSHWCKSEVDAARLMGKRVLVALIGLDDAVLTSDITDEQWLDLANDPDGFDRLARALKSAGLDPSTFSFPDGRRPYPGLSALDVEDAAIFFGRDAQIVRGLDKIRGMSRACVERLLIILGASGAGKSSFMRAGLWPRLRRDDRTWLPLAIVRPERAVLSGTFGLAASLELTIAERRFTDSFVKQGLPVSRVAIQDFIEASTEGFSRLLAALRIAANVADNASPLTIVLLIDQAEEFFNEDAGPEARKFVEILVDTMAFDPRFLTLVAIRSDAFPRLQSDLQFAGIPKDSFPLDVMLESSWREVIEGPARIVRPKPLLVDSDLTEALLADARGQDALPLLAFTLEWLFTAYQADGRLTLAGYRRLGGIKGVIRAAVMNAIADGVGRGELPKAPEEQIALVRAAFIPHLARVNSAGEFVRRVSSWDEIPSRARPLVERLIERRLITRDRRVLAGKEIEVVEITHEAILREWKELNDAMTEEREFLIAKGQLEEDVNEWRNAPAQAKHEALLFGNKLAKAQQWLCQRPEDLSDEEISFVQASMDAATVAQRRKLLARRLAVTASVAASAVLSVIALYSYNQSINSKLSEILATLRVGEIQAASAKFRDLAGLPGISFWSRTIAAQSVATEILDSAVAKEINWNQDLDDFVGSRGQKRVKLEEQYGDKIACAQTIDLCVSGKTDFRLDARGSRSSFHIGPRAFLTALELQDGKETSEKAGEAVKVTSFFQPNPSRNLIAISADGSLVAISEDRIIHIWSGNGIEHQNQAPDRSITFDFDFDKLAFLPDAHDIVITGKGKAAFLTMEPRRVRTEKPDGAYEIAPERDGLPPSPESGELGNRRLKLSYDKSAQELAFYGARNGKIKIADKTLASIIGRIDAAKTPNIFQIRPDLLALTLDGTECRRAGHDQADDESVLSDLLLIKLADDRSSVVRASLLVCGATYNHDWGDKARLSVSVARPLTDAPIFLGGRQFGGLYEISREGIPGRLLLLCDDQRRPQEPEIKTYPDSQVASYTYQDYSSKCPGTTETIYNAARGEIYLFGRPYNSGSGAARVTRFNLGSRVTDQFPNTNKAYFDSVSWIAASNDGKLLASEKDQAGLELFVLDRMKKVALPRTAAEPLPYKDRKLRLFFGGIGEVWITHGDGSTLWAVPEADGGQFDFVSLALQKTIDIDVGYTPAIGDYYVERVRTLVDEEKIDDATALRDRAVSKDGSLQPRLNEQLAQFRLRKGVEALSSSKDDDAQTSFTETLRLAPAMKPQIDAAWAEALLNRGRRLFEGKKFVEAIDVFQAASLRGSNDAEKLVWLSVMRRADQLGGTGAAPQALSLGMANYLDLSSKTRNDLGLADLKVQLQTITYLLFAIFRQNAVATRVEKDTNQCDVLAAHPQDPFRTTAPAMFDKMDANAAIAACDKAIEENPNEGRFYFQRSRAQVKAATNSARDKSAAQKYLAARQSDLGESMKLGYPFAFVAQGSDYEQGESVKKDKNKAADFYLEAFNRAVACCGVAAINKLIAERENKDIPSALRAAHALGFWAAALGNVEARDLLSHWSTAGELQSGKIPDDAKWTDLPPWLTSTESK